MNKDHMSLKITPGLWWVRVAGCSFDIFKNHLIVRLGFPFTQG